MTRASFGHASRQLIPHILGHKSTCVILRNMDEIGVPNCPKCLLQFDVAGDGEHVHLECPECGLVKL